MYLGRTVELRHCGFENLITDRGEHTLVVASQVSTSARTKP
jgi:hypothetical protein